MTPLRLFAILFITACTAVAWFILGSALTVRSSQPRLTEAVSGGWGPALEQLQPSAWYESPGSQNGRTAIRPAASAVDVNLTYEPKRKGLLWYRAYAVDFRAEYTFANPTPIPQTVYIRFALPSPQASYNAFSLTLNGKPTTANVTGREPVTEAVLLPPEGKATLVAAYRTRGLDRWTYSFGDEARVQNFLLKMRTNFAEIDFPAGSPTSRQQAGEGWTLEWAYPDEIGVRPVAMEMPKVLNPGPVASRITFFAPVSLLFFFAVLIVLCLVQGVNLHPMHFFFLAAGCFAFQLLFAYLVDLIPLGVAFVVSAVVSLALVSGYLLLARGRAFASKAALAQFAYMVLFSYSFFFDGLTGLTITIGAILTLAILMAATARVNWEERFRRKPKTTIPPTIPAAMPQ
jgi:hypothetical protein